MFTIREAALYSFEGKCDIIISHFHGDHNWWLAKHSVGDEGVFEGDTLSLEYRRPEYRHLYVGSHTAKYMSEGEIVDRPLTLYVPDEETDAGKTKIDIIPIPNSHCKGALILMIDDEYAFIGDASYCAGNKEGCYNAQLLKEEIEFLEALPASKLLVSHDRKFIRPRQVVLRQLKSVYEKRIPDSPYIPV